MAILLKKIFLCVFLFFSALSISKASSSFECRSRLTDNFSKNTIMVNFNYDPTEIRDYRKDYLADGIAVLRLFLERKGCSRNDVNFGKGPFGRSASRCRLVERYSPHSRVCYIETNLGYFLFSKNLIGNAQIIFNLWD